MNTFPFLNTPLLKKNFNIQPDSNSSNKKIRETELDDLSINDLIENEFKSGSDQIFKLYSGSQDLYLQVKKTTSKINGKPAHMLQFLDKTKDVMLQKHIADNKFLQIINAFVSHELRNPLNSITSQNN